MFKLECFKDLVLSINPTQNHTQLFQFFNAAS